MQYQILVKSGHSWEASRVDDQDRKHVDQPTLTDRIEARPTDRNFSPLNSVLLHPITRNTKELVYYSLCVYHEGAKKDTNSSLWGS